MEPHSATVMLVTAHNRAGLAECRRIRHRVFVEEQGIPEALEFDDLDRASWHALATVGGRAVATARMVVQERVGHIGRVAVLPAYRRRGLGRLVTGALITEAGNQGLVKLALTPHDYLESYYRAMGFVTVPGSEAIAGHRLIRMEKDLQSP